MILHWKDVVYMKYLFEISDNRVWVVDLRYQVDCLVNTCSLKNLRSSSSTSTRLRKYLTENFWLISHIVGVNSYLDKNNRIGMDSPERGKRDKMMELIG